MKLSELYERVREHHPELSDNIVISIFNKYSVLFQHATNIGVLRKLTIPKIDFTNGICSKYSPLYIDCIVEQTKGALSCLSVSSLYIDDKKVSAPNTYFYFCVGDSIGLAHSDGTGSLSYYSPDNNVDVYGRIINPSNMISLTSTPDSQIDDLLGIILVNAIIGDRYLSRPDTVKEAEYYMNLYRNDVKTYRIIGNKTPTPQYIKPVYF